MIDVGAHRGETLIECLKPVYNVSKIYCIEPASQAIQKLKLFRDRRIILENWSAWSVNGTATLYSSGSVGGSLFEDKPRVSVQNELVPVKNFGEWLDGVKSSDRLCIKINIEGAELELLKTLKEVKSLERIMGILVSIDLPKVPSLMHLEKTLRNLIEEIGVPITIRHIRDPQEAIRHWLTELGLRTKKVSFKSWLRYYISLPKFELMRLVLKPVIPHKVWIWLAYKFGPDRISGKPLKT